MVSKVMKKEKAILFDLDGTLWDATAGILKTWNGVIASHPETKRALLTMEELGGYLGLPMTEIANRMFPYNNTEEKKCLLEECCKQENEYLSKFGGILYPDLEKVLKVLKQDYLLFVVSNCQQGYIESFLQAHKLAEYFDDIECWGNNLLPKGENNKLIIERNHVKQAVYVGDTAGDEESARVAGIPFVFAAYGFGQAVQPDYSIKALAELPELMKTIW